MLLIALLVMSLQQFEQKVNKLRKTAQRKLFSILKASWKFPKMPTAKEFARSRCAKFH